MLHFLYMPLYNYMSTFHTLFRIWQNQHNASFFLIAFQWSYLYSIWLKDLVLTHLYWYMTTRKNRRKSITGHMRVTLCHEYIMIWYIRVPDNRITRSMQSSVVTYSYWCNRHFDWRLYKVTCMWPVMEFSQTPPPLRCDISVKGNKWEIWFECDWPLLTSNWFS